MTTTTLPDAVERTERLVRLLDVRPLGADRFEAYSVRHLGKAVFGGQVLAQALVAAGRTIPEGRTPHSLHGYFLRPGDYDEPIVLAVDQLRDGRSFSARRVQALQGDVPILSTIASFATPGDGPEHAEPMPDVVPADGLPSLADVWGEVDHSMARYWAHEQPIDLRYVSPSIFVEPQQPPGTLVQTWWRTAGRLPDDPLLHAAAVVYTSDITLLEPVLRRHGKAWRDTGMSMASIDHALWFHRVPRADEWLLYDATSPAAGSSRGLCTGRMFTADGRLVASAAQEGLFRPRRAGSG